MGNEKPDNRTQLPSDLVSKEYVKHRHLANEDGFVPEIKKKFVKFVLRVKTHDNLRLNLGACLCNGCYRSLQRKYEEASGLHTVKSPD